MNQRFTNGCSNPAKSSGQRVKRGNGRRIAQHYRNLPAFVAIRGLARSACLYLRHGSMRRREQFAAVLGVNRLSAGLIEPERHAGSVHVHPLASCCCKHHLGQFGRYVGGIREVWASVHGHLRSGPIPPMSESYPITSDNASTICSARNAA